MVLSLFVVSTVSRALWNKISKELVTTRLTKYSKTTFAITHTKARNWVSLDSAIDFCNFFFKRTIKILLTCCIIQDVYIVKEYVGA
jgi:hypothetical protein